ncbi:MAG: HD domain-containing protein [Sulfurimonas sp.]|nr:HD domain-containing protein [Sulfurimonas sp.]
MKNIKNKILSKTFLDTLLFRQNKWHQHGVFLHTLRVVYYTLKAKEYKLLGGAFFHDIGKPFVAFEKYDDEIPFKEYSFTDHEETSYQLIKNWFFLSEYTKKIVRYHYLLRDMNWSKDEDQARYKSKKAIWDTLDDDMKDDLARFLVYDDQGKGKKKI